MSRSIKLMLDILLGAVVPILVLSYLTDALGAVTAYLLAALIPVGWVFVDLFFITKRINFITGFLGLNALVRGLLAFWFVDGLLYALKDTSGGVLTVMIFGGSLLIGRPVVRAFAEQSLDPRSPEQESAVEGLFRERPVARALFWSTALLTAVNVATSLANFLLNLRIVTAAFGTQDFNTQVAQVNAITRIALGIPEMAAWGVALYLIFRALYKTLHTQTPDGSRNDDLWDLIEKRDAQRDAQKEHAATNTEGSTE
ncbi:MAG TPA: VC0807 family protein [Rubrobacteraceae bacterium]|nr:VC0807 family protein [Rubrobacteraceae bacterium]